MSTYQVVLRVKKRKLEEDDIKHEDGPLLASPPSKKQKRDECKERDEGNGPSCNLSSMPLVMPKRMERVIILNVGGIKYSTTLQTLTGYESMLKARFSGNYSMESEDDGSYFFDRDGGLFKYILKYLRTGNLLVPQSWTQTELRGLYLEAQYFAVKSMLEDLSLRFFNSDILTHDVLKREIIGKINGFQCVGFGRRTRRICSTNEWTLLSNYDATKDQDVKQKVNQMEKIVSNNELLLFLMSTDDTVYGQLLAFREIVGIHSGESDANTIVFGFKKRNNLDRPVDPVKHITYGDKCRLLTYLEKIDCRTFNLRGTMVGIGGIEYLYPLPVFIWKEDGSHKEFQLFDYLLSAGLVANKVEKMEVWRVTTRPRDFEFHSSSRVNML